MKPLLLTLGALTLSCTILTAQGPRPTDLGASPQPVGDPGVVWYTTWDTALEEAKRSNRPIFFMAAAATCNGISGVFWPGYASTQNSLFSEKEFIEASRNYVCVRLESYESKEHQDMVRSFLNGRFANTAFCLLAPDGKTRLSGTGRSPKQALAGRGRRNRDDANGSSVTESMDRIAAKYKTKGDSSEAVVQDFHSFRQALNVASADQRLLLLIAAPEQDLPDLHKSLRNVHADPDIIGRFHTDFADPKSDADWTNAVEGASKKPGLYIIQADPFGMEGKVLKHLPLDTKPKNLKTALLAANSEFAKTEKRKVYKDHVAQGRRQNIFFKNGMPYGEDRDGDGKIDQRGGGPRRQR